MDRQTDRQTEKEADKLTDGRTDRQRDRKTDRWTDLDRQAEVYKRTHIQMDMNGHTDRRTDRQTDRLDGQVDRRTNKQTDIQTGIQIDRQTDRQTDRKIDIQTAGVHTDRQRFGSVIFLWMGIQLKNQNRIRILVKYCTHITKTELYFSFSFIWLKITISKFDMIRRRGVQGNFFLGGGQNEKSQPEGPIIRAEARRAKAAGDGVGKFSIFEPC